MRKPVVLITGANGEIGHGLIHALGRDARHDIVALDLHPLDKALRPLCVDFVVGDVLDDALIQRLSSQYQVRAIHHLAALLSTRGEYTPVPAHQVNVGGTLNLLQLAAEQGREAGEPVKFLFPSSIAVFGMPSLEAKNAAGPVHETDWLFPTTMYGCNKLYCEQLGRYFSDHYRQLDPARGPAVVDFRALRFPGLISPATLPSGGTTDYAPEMLHAAAKGEPYACFVPETTRLPFMTMHDAIRALTLLDAAPAASLTQRAYNVTAFSLSAADIRDRVLRAFPGAEISFAVDEARTGIVDTWPAEVDDAPARRDWRWAPEHDADRAFDEHLVPAISRRYQGEPG